MHVPQSITKVLFSVDVLLMSLRFSFLTGLVPVAYCGNVTFGRILILIKKGGLLRYCRDVLNLHTSFD